MYKLFVKAAVYFFAQISYIYVNNIAAAVKGKVPGVLLYLLARKHYVFVSYKVFKYGKFL